MVFNSLFVQNNSSKDSMMFAKAGGLKGKNYLFSDIMQVCLGGETTGTAKFNQFLANVGDIDTDESNSNLMKLTEGNIPSQNDVKFDKLLQFLGLTAEQFPEQQGISIEIPKVSAEELNSILKKITKNAENEDVLNKVIQDKLASSGDEENLLVTLEFDHKTIAIDIIPSVELSVSNSVNPENGTQINSAANSETSVYNITVSILPSDVSESIMSKFVEATQLLKKEAEGTTTLNGTDVKKYEIFKNSDGTEIKTVQTNSQANGLAHEVEELIPDKAKKVTIYSILNDANSASEKQNNDFGELNISDPLKKIQINNQTASLNITNSSDAEKIDAKLNSLTDSAEKASLPNKENLPASETKNPQIAQPGTSLTNNQSEVTSVKVTATENVAQNVENKLKTESLLNNQEKVVKEEVAAQVNAVTILKKDNSKNSAIKSAIEEFKNIKNGKKTNFNDPVQKNPDSKSAKVLKDFMTETKNGKIEVTQLKTEVAPETIKQAEQIKTEKPVVQNEIKELKDLETLQKGSVKESVNAQTDIKTAKDEKSNPIILEKKSENIKTVESTKPAEIVNVKPEVEHEKQNTSTSSSSESTILKEISGLSQTANEQQSGKHGEHNTNHQVNFAQNVEAHNSERISFEDVINAEKAEKVVKQADLVKEVHHFIERKDSTQLVLKIEPADLGKVKITLDLTEQIMKANIEVESEVVRQTLEKSMADLQNQLGKSGIQLGSVTISLQDADGKNKQNPANKKKSNNKSNGGENINNETGETQAVKSMGYNTYDYVA